MSQIFDDFIKYRDRYGLNQLTTNGEQGNPEDNGTLFTMEYLICMLSNLATPGVAKDFQQEIARLRAVFSTLEPIPGLSVRYPDNMGVDSMDNASALLTFSLLWGNREFARRRRNHGLSVKCDGVDQVQDAVNSKKYSWLARVWSTFQLAGFFTQKNFWNVAQPTKFNFFGWHGKSPGLMGWLDICATGRTSCFRATALWVGQMWSIFAKPGDTDAWKLAYVIWYALKQRGGMWEWGYRQWCKRLIKMYPRGMIDVYALYYLDPNHPIHKYSVTCLS